MTVKLSVRQIGQMNADVKTLLNFVSMVRAKPADYPQELGDKSGQAIDACHRLTEVARDLMGAEVSVKG
jgi:hypothetical protein